MKRLSRSQARRLALGAQGFGGKPPPGRIDRRHLRSMMRRLELLQLDSVPAVVRTQYMPFFSRLGVYRRDLLDEIAYDDDEWFEAWTHESSLVPVETEPLLRWHKKRSAEGETWKGLLRLAKEEPHYVQSVLDEVADRGPMTASELSDPRPQSGDWWANRSMGQLALSWLWRIGAVGIRRTRNFEKAFVSLWHECATPEEALTRTFAALDEAFVDAFERTKRGTRANGDRSTTETDDVRNDGDDVQTTSDVSNVSNVRRGAKSLERFPGCTAIAALRWGARVYVANAGDCRAVVCREPLPETRGGSGADQARWVALSVDHVADTNEAERARVVETAGPDALRVVNGVRRVGPAGLAVTRCVGDGDCKPYGVIAAPEVTAYAVDASDEDTHTSGKDFALVLACDGLWDVVSNADARDLVLDTVKEPSMSAKRLGSEALARGSGDNVTVVVAFLKETNTAETVTWERAF